MPSSMPQPRGVGRRRAGARTRLLTLLGAGAPATDHQAQQRGRPSRLTSGLTAAAVWPDNASGRGAPDPRSKRADRTRHAVTAFPYYCSMSAALVDTRIVGRWWRWVTRQRWLPVCCVSLRGGCRRTMTRLRTVSATVTQLSCDHVTAATLMFKTSSAAIMYGHQRMMWRRTLPLDAAQCPRQTHHSASAAPFCTRVTDDCPVVGRSCLLRGRGSRG